MAPAPVVLLCVFVCVCFLCVFRAEWKKWDKHGHDNFWMYIDSWGNDISYKG